MARGVDQSVEKILGAAEQVFAERGFDGSRTRDIAARAGVNVSTLHYHYKTKEDLYAAVMRSMIEELRARVWEALETPAVTDVIRLQRFVAAHFDALAARPHFPRLIVDALIHAPDMVREVARHTAGPLLETLLPRLAQGLDLGVLRPMDVRHALLSALAMNMIYFLATPIVEVLFGKRAYTKNALEDRKAAVIDLLFLGLLKREPKPEER